jgi:predicted RNase H-like HicB family nuclease
MNTIALGKEDSNVPRKRKYKIIIEKCTNGEFVAKAPSIPGCEGRGKTMEAAVTEIRSGITRYLEECQRLGKDMTKDCGEE